MSVPSNLRYRLVEEGDLALLLQYREECGWGVSTLRQGFSDPDRVYCIFQARQPDRQNGDASSSLSDGNTASGSWKDVGMGCWYLHQPDDLDLACRDKNVVHIASLFISRQYQGLGYGTTAMDILERGAVERFDAKLVTLDTTAYWTDSSPERIEDPSRPGRTVPWYKARGYTQFRDHRPLFPYPTASDPDRKLTAIFLHKPSDMIWADIEKQKAAER